MTILLPVPPVRVPRAGQRLHAVERWTGVTTVYAPDLPETGCDWCGLIGRVTTCRVIGAPSMYDSTVYDDTRDCCAWCVPLVVGWAYEHAVFPELIRVEVSR